MTRLSAFILLAQRLPESKTWANGDGRVVQCPRGKSQWGRQRKNRDLGSQTTAEQVTNTVTAQDDRAARDPRDVIQAWETQTWRGGRSLQEDPGFQLRVQGTVTVQEGLCVLVPCSFSYPSRVWSSSGQLFISWFRARSYMNCDEPVATNDPDHKVKPETKARFQLVGKVKSRDCSVSIRDARMEDEGTYAFTIDTRKIKYTYADQRLNVQVTGLTEKPAIHVPEPLESGRPSRLRCSLPGSCQGGHSLAFSWSGDALNSMDPGTLKSSELILTPRPQDHNTSLTCQVQLAGAWATTERTIGLRVSSAQQWDSWPLVLMMMRGTLMGAGFLLTYGLTWIYCTRCADARERGAERSP
ncbi:sialic acid-binding Ig-like lectin 14 isoform X2 [Fukomys damarensis]|uniref:sialic acid-binding Ig-like lectin 14 isoform X2 n=1 Tax=Fukomys damarensis TaxID=885580 RepID=UPI0014553F68|nr:sialic acid-binding Ig-like lectin 14 isoform X2 [Fukomys damarensis]